MYVSAADFFRCCCRGFYAQPSTQPVTPPREHLPGALVPHEPHELSAPGGRGRKLDESTLGRDFSR